MVRNKKTAVLLIIVVLLTQGLFNGLVMGGKEISDDNENKIFFKDIAGHWAEDAVYYLADKGLVAGYHTEDGYVIKPQSNITRAEFLAVLLKTKPSFKEVPENIKAFSDVKEGDWFWEIVKISSSNGIVEGYPDGTFKPNHPITRAEISTILTKFNDWDEKDLDNSVSAFSDVKEDAWYYLPVVICKSQNIINGYPDGTFKPQNYALRGEAFALLANYVKESDFPLSKEDDSEKDETPVDEKPEDDLPKDDLRGDETAKDDTKEGGTPTGDSPADTSPKEPSPKDDNSERRNKFIYEDNDLEAIKALNDGEMPEITIDGETYIPSFISGSYTSHKVYDIEDAILSLYSVRTLMDIGNPEEEFQPLRTISLAGINTYRLQQVYKDIPVYARQIIVTTNDENITRSLRSNYYPDVKYSIISTEPEKTADEVLEVLAKELDKTAIYDPSQDKIHGEYCDLDVYDKQLVIYTLGNTDPLLAWRVFVGGVLDEYFIGKEYFLSSYDGTILKQYDTIYEVAVQGTGDGHYQKGLKFTTNEIEKGVIKKTKAYEMYDPDRKIKILDGEYKWEIDLSAEVMVDDDNIWIDNYQKSAVDAMVNIAKVYDYYKEVLNHESFDGKGMNINVMVHSPSEEKSATYKGAAWTFTSLFNRKYICVGDFDGTSYAAALDVMAHEFTHGVQHHITGLLSEHQSHALNEAFADIMGNLIEHGYIYTDDDWLMGESVDNGKYVVRSMSDPPSYGCYVHNGMCSRTCPNRYPDHMSKYKVGQGNQHRNANIIDKAFYNMYTAINGDKGSSGLSCRVFSRIWYNALGSLSPNANFNDCRQAVIKAVEECKDYKFSRTEINAIKKAFDDVGVYDLIDLNPDAWYCQDFKDALRLGLVMGYPDGTMRPMQKMTYAEYIKMVLTAFRVDEKGLPTARMWRNHWAGEYLQYALDRNLINLYVNPDSYITREEAGRILWKVFKCLDYERAKHLSLKEYGRKAVIEFSAKKQKWGDGQAFVDQRNISLACEEAVYQLYLNGIFTGYNDNSLRPQEILDRATCVTILMKCFKNFDF